jgi:hypothetical protein
VSCFRPSHNHFGSSTVRICAAEVVACVLNDSLHLYSTLLKSQWSPLTQTREPSCGHGVALRHGAAARSRLGAWSPGGLDTERALFTDDANDTRPIYTQ